jgi:hypothetical protein
MNQPPANSDGSAAAPILDYRVQGVPAKSVRVRRFASGFEANLALSALHAQGIRAQLVGEGLQNMLAIYGTASGGVDLLVTQDDAQDARRILEQIDHRRAERAAQAVSPCPHCGNPLSRGYDRRRGAAGLLLIMTAAGVFVAQSWMALLLIPLFGVGVVLLVTALNRRTCRRCGNIWSPAADED